MLYSSRRNQLFLLKLALCTGVLSGWNRKGLCSNCCYTIKSSLQYHAVALRLLLREMTKVVRPGCPNTFVNRQKKQLKANVSSNARLILHVVVVTRATITFIQSN